MFDSSIINPLFSIIIPALNEESYINHCLESIKKLDAKLERLDSSVLRDVDRRLILLEARMDAAFEILDGKRKTRNI